MNTYIIVVESDTDSINTLSGILSSLGLNIRVLSNVFLLNASLSAAEIRDYVGNSISTNQIFVSAVQLPAAWRNIQLDTQLIKKLYNVQD